MRAFALAVAPGDAEICCGGTLARVTAAKGAAAICTLSSGNSRGSNQTPREFAEAHKSEAQTAADTLGAELIWLGHSDFGVTNDSVTRMLLADQLREFRPDAVLAPASVNTIHDLRDAWRLAVDAAHIAATPSARTDHDPLPSVPAVFAYEPRWFEGFEPDTYVDVSNTIETKRAAIAQFTTLARWYMSRSGTDISQASDTVSAYRGLQAGVDFAEAFASRPTVGSRATSRVLP